MRRLTVLAVCVCLSACSEDTDLGETERGDADALDDVVEVEAPDTMADSVEPDTTIVDTGTEETTPIDSATDSNVGDTTAEAAADTSTPDTRADVADAFVPDTFVADTFMPDTAPLDTCVVNACGGCGVLANAPGTRCGFCTSTWTCSSDKSSTFCPAADDRNLCGGCGTLANPPGASCGTCGTMKYACAADKAATYCPTPDDTNGCGGCGSLMGKPLGAACGQCNAGTTTCFTTVYTHCTESPAVANLNTPCGFCMTYQCSGMSTTCQSSGTYYPSTTALSQTSATSKVSVATTGEAAFRYQLDGEEQGLDVALRISRQQLGGAPDPTSALTIALVAGYLGSEVSSITIPATSIPFDAAGTPSFVTYAFSPSPTESINPSEGTAHIRITVRGTSDVFYIYGAPSTAPLPFIETVVRPAGGGAAYAPTFTPAITLRVRACR